MRSRCFVGPACVMVLFIDLTDVCSFPTLRFRLQRAAVPSRSRPWTRKVSERRISTARTLIPDNSETPPLLPAEEEDRYYRQVRQSALLDPLRAPL